MEEVEQALDRLALDEQGPHPAAVTTKANQPQATADDIQVLFKTG